MYFKMALDISQLFFGYWIISFIILETLFPVSDTIKAKILLTKSANTSNNTYLDIEYKDVLIMVKTWILILILIGCYVACAKIVIAPQDCGLQQKAGHLLANN